MLRSLVVQVSLKPLIGVRWAGFVAGGGGVDDDYKNSLPGARNDVVQ